MSLPHSGKWAAERDPDAQAFIQISGKDHTLFQDALALATGHGMGVLHFFEANVHASAFVALSKLLMVMKDMDANLLEGKTLAETRDMSEPLGQFIRMGQDCIAVFLVASVTELEIDMIRALRKQTTMSL